MKDGMAYVDAPRLKAEAAKQEQKQGQVDVPDNAISTLSKLLGDGVALVDNEVLVKDLEDLATREISHGECVYVVFRRRFVVQRRRRFGWPLGADAERALCGSCKLKRDQRRLRFGWK